MGFDKAYRQRIRQAIIENRENYPDHSDAKYAKILGISSSVYSRLKNGETEKIASTSFWIQQGMRLGVTSEKKNWNFARTSVYVEIEDTIRKATSLKRAYIIIDECGIGKTFCTKHVIKSMKNAFYMDCSQARNKRNFTRRLAKIMGLDDKGRLDDVKEVLKYYINEMQPFIALDDAGYLDSDVFIEIIELWNATEDRCGWMMLGDKSLEQKVTRGIKSKKPGYEAIFSRFSDDWVRFIKNDTDRINYLQQLVGDVASVNLEDQSLIDVFIAKCIGGKDKEKTLRYLKELISIHKIENEQSKNSKELI